MGFFDFLFSPPKPKHPRVTNEMLQPVDATISAADAKRILKSLYLKIGYCADKAEANLEAEMLADDMRYHEEDLSNEYDFLKEEYQQELADWQEELGALKEDLKDAAPEDKAGAKEEIAAHQQYKPSDEAARKAKQALATFKADKRAYLIAYINTALHGKES